MSYHYLLEKFELEKLKYTTAFDAVCINIETLYSG